jgi:hypothetical protein
VTHDDEWASVLSEVSRLIHIDANIYPGCKNDGEFPEDSELIRRVSRKYNIGTTSGDVSSVSTYGRADFALKEGVWLQDSETFDVLIPTLYRNVEMNTPVAVYANCISFRYHVEADPVVQQTEQTSNR